MNKKIIRYIISTLVLMLMVISAILFEEKEIIFPEMAALTIGMWIVEKDVWRVRPKQMLVLMTLGAIVGVCIVKFLPLLLIFKIALAFSFAAICLIFTKTSLIPLLSACILPVMLGTESFIYPLAVCILTFTIVTIENVLCKLGIRKTIDINCYKGDIKQEAILWIKMLIVLFIVSFFAIYVSNLFIILPPLIVTFAEFVHSKAGFRSRPFQIIFLLLAASSIGTLFCIIGRDFLLLNDIVIVACIFISLLLLFELVGKYFAPAGAMALIPLILPSNNLIYLPIFQLLGSLIFIAIALVFFQKCYKWPKAKLYYCFNLNSVKNILTHRNIDDKTNML